MARPAAPKKTPKTARSIDLTDADWRWATWRSLPPYATSGAVVSFDLDASVAVVAKRVKLIAGTDWFDFSRSGAPARMSPEEARFWFACLLGDTKRPPAAIAAAYGKRKPAALTLDGAYKTFRKRVRWADATMGYAFAALFPPVEIARRFFLEGPFPDFSDTGPGDFFHALREHALLLLTDDEKASLREAIRPEITPAAWPADPYAVMSAAFLLAPLLGMHAELEAVAASIPDDRYTGGYSWGDVYNLPQHLLFGLGSAARVDHHVRRLGLKLNQPGYARAWLAHTEFSGLDHLAESVIAARNRGLAAKLAGVLALVDAPEAVAPMRAVAKRSKAPQVAEAWLAAHPQYKGA
jgi:hypothetical protein